MSRSEEGALREFRSKAAIAPPGWMPAPEDRLEINDDVLRLCLGIDPRDTRPGRMTSEQRLELISLWFSGEEAAIPYEKWGLERPAWLPRT